MTESFYYKVLGSMSATLTIKNSEFLKKPVIQNTFWGPLQIF